MIDAPNMDGRCARLGTREWVAARAILPDGPATLSNPRPEPAERAVKIIPPPPSPRAARLTWQEIAERVGSSLTLVHNVWTGRRQNVAVRAKLDALVLEYGDLMPAVRGPRKRRMRRPSASVPSVAPRGRRPYQPKVSPPPEPRAPVYLGVKELAERVMASPEARRLMGLLNFDERIAAAKIERLKALGCVGLPARSAKSGKSTAKDFNGGLMVRDYRKKVGVKPKKEFRGLEAA